MGAHFVHDPLSAALFGRTRRAVLALLFGHPDESFYVREVLRAVGTGRGAVQRELKRLEQAGIVRRWRRGPQVFFQANAECPVFAELRGFILKTAGVAGILQAALNPLADRIRVAFLYGSVACGEAHPDSDVDVCVVGAVTFAEVTQLTRGAQDKLGREVNPTVYPPAEFARKLTEGHHFLSTIADGPKIFLIGDEREFAGLAQERLAGSASDQPAGNRRAARDRHPRSR